MTENKFSWRPFFIAISCVALLACVAGVVFGWVNSAEWSSYAALPVTPLAEAGKQATGKLMRVEGEAWSNSPILGPDGTPLAFQRARFTHSTGARRTTTNEQDYDYDRALPKTFVLRDEKATAGSNELVVLTSALSDFSPENIYDLSGTPREVDKRIERVISPAFTDYYYVPVKGPVDGSHLLLWSIPQGSAITLLGTFEGGSVRPPSLRPKILFVSAGREFVTQMRALSSHSRMVGTWVVVGGLVLLAAEALLYFHLRRKGSLVAGTW